MVLAAGSQTLSVAAHPRRSHWHRPAPLASFAHPSLCLSFGGGPASITGVERAIAGATPRARATQAQQSSSSSSSSLGWRRRSGGADGAGDALGLNTGRDGAGFGTAAGRAGGIAGAGTRGAATIVRGSGAATVLVADEELGGSLGGLATENETVTAGSGGGSGRGSPLIAMTAIPTMMPREVAATAAATSRNMTIYRLEMGHAPPVYATAAAPCSSLWHREGQGSQKKGSQKKSWQRKGWRKRLVACRGHPAVRASSRPPRAPLRGSFGRHSIGGSKRVPQRSQPEMDCTHS